MQVLSLRLPAFRLINVPLRATLSKSPLIYFAKCYTNNMGGLIAAVVLCLMVVHAHTQSCGGQDDALVRKQRIQSIRSNILAQLGPDYYNNQASPNGTAVDNATMEAFYAISNATIKQKNRMQEKNEAFRPFFAEKIISFPAIPSRNQSHTAKRAASPQALLINVLDKFRIQFNFSIDYQLNDITKAQLVLFQLPCAASDTCNDKQYVEIRSVDESDGGTKIIDGAYVRLLDSGYQVFDVMEAVGHWIEQQASKSVVLEVTSYCFSSLDCNKPVNGTPPAHIQFVKSTNDLKTVPRLNLNVKSSLEYSHENSRAKRQASGVGFCTQNQALCCLQPLTVNVHTDLNLPFIVAPVTIDINYCQGVCPRTPGGDLMVPQIFATYSQLLSGPAASLTPCCSGNSYTDITVFVINSVTGQREQLVLPKIVVNSCRCA